MADEEKEQQEAQEEQPKKKGKSKLLIIIILAVVLLGGGGFFAYTKFIAKPKEAEAKAEEKNQEEVVKEEQPVLFALDPFVVNLSDRGRFLKCSMQLELVDKSFEEMAKEKTPHIRDAIITLISSKTADSITTAEGKFQLKDEILMRANASVGKDIFKNVYFTDFVMQ